MGAKIQKTWYADRELSDRLRIEAAKRNVKQNDIVEAAVRKELRMVSKQDFTRWRINTGFLGGNLFSEEPDHLVDESASCARYKEMLHEALELEFPGAEITVHYEVMASGALPLPLQTYVITPDGDEYRPGEFGDGGRVAEQVDDVAGHLWEAWEWVVYL